MIVLFVLLILLVALFIVLRISSQQKFRSLVNELFTEEKEQPVKNYHSSQLNGLPDPVQKYFRFALRDGQPYIRQVRLKHDGWFKTGQKNKWIAIKGEQYFSTQKPGFVWRGKTALVTAVDRFVSGSGGLSIFLLSAVRVANGSGQKYDEGELQRCLAESVWFPTNLLPNENLKWEPVDARTAKLTYNYHQLKIVYLVHFSLTGEITHLETKRYMGEKSRETWIGKTSAYQEINGVQVPTMIEAIYQLTDGDYSYARFHITEINYAIPHLF